MSFLNISCLNISFLNISKLTYSYFLRVSEVHWVLSRSGDPGGSGKLQHRSGDGDSKKTRTCHEAECTRSQTNKVFYNNV